MSIVVFKFKNDDFLNGNANIGTQTYKMNIQYKVRQLKSIQLLIFKN